MYVTHQTLILRVTALSASLCLEDLLCCIICEEELKKTKPGKPAFATCVLVKLIFELMQGVKRITFCFPRIYNM